MNAKIRILFVLVLAWNLLGLKVGYAQKPVAGATTATSAQKCTDDSKVNPDLQCGRVYEPVCGCNGKTYDNACDAQRSGVMTTTKGACPGSLEETVIQAVKAWENAYNEGDAKKLESTFARNAVLVTPGGSVDGSKGIGSLYTGIFAEEEGKIAITIVDIVALADNYVLVSGSYKVDAVKKATREPAVDAGRYVNVSQEVDGKLVTVYHEVYTDAVSGEKAPAAKAPSGN